jgi:teichoic acid transport system ATP-binding protein
MQPKVLLKNVTKKYALYNNKREKLLGIFLPRQEKKEFYALKNVSFEVLEGETIGIVGMNGSGKSTLSNILGQVIKQTSGEVKINGVSSLIAISAGLNINLSGIENIKLKCLMLGLSNKKIEELLPFIIDFADIGDFIYQPVKNYSSGMKSRLGFAISVHTNPDILIIDEALSVGDQTFYDKCIGKVNEFKSQGKTIFFISHSAAQVRKISDRVIWMNFGEIKEFGRTSEVLAKYKEYIIWFNDLSDIEKKQYKKEMLSKQKQNDLGVQSGERGNKHKRIKAEKGKRLFLFVQFILLSVLLLLSGASLFLTNPLETVSDTFANLIESKSSKEDDVQTDTTKQSESINKTGNISEKSVELYVDKELSQNKINLPFATEVYVEKKIGDSYKISYKYENYYINSNAVSFDQKQILSDISIQDLLFIFHEPVTSSYSYYLAFLDSTYDEITGSLRGMTNERQDSEGSTYLVYGYDDVTYRINSNGDSEAIIFSNIFIDEKAIAIFEKDAKLISSDGDLYLIESEDYKWTFNKKNNELLLELKEEIE